MSGAGCRSAGGLASLHGMATPFPALDGSAPRQQKFNEPPEMGIDPSKRYTATMETTLGTIDNPQHPLASPRRDKRGVCIAVQHK